ncbi:MAG TPA: hypothetical protein VIG94_02040 [Faecalibacter sp.]
MRIVKIILLMAFATNTLNAQNDTVTLKVISIKELDSKVFEIRGVDSSKDTLRILSLKDDIKDSCLYEKIRQGASYQFNLKPKPAYIDNYVVRVGEKIYWETGNPYREMPYFADNIKSNYIKKD